MRKKRQNFVKQVRRSQINAFFGQKEMFQKIQKVGNIDVQKDKPYFLSLPIKSYQKQHSRNPEKRQLIKEYIHQQFPFLNPDKMEDQNDEDQDQDEDEDYKKTDQEVTKQLKELIIQTQRLVARKKELYLVERKIAFRKEMQKEDQIAFSKEIQEQDQIDLSASPKIGDLQGHE